MYSTNPKAAETFKTEYNQALNIATPEIRDLGHRFISIDFPSERIIASLGAELRMRYHDNILIVNMSERDYDTDQLPGHVLQASFRGMPSPSVELLCRLCLQIYQWLSRSPANVVAIHCFPGLSRTAVVVCSYLAWSGAVVHPVDALIDICSGLKIDVDSNPILPSQKRYLNYFFEFLTSPVSLRIPAKSLGIAKLILNGIPNIPVAEDDAFRPFIEIWRDGHLVFSSLPREQLSIQDLVASVKGYPLSDGDLCVSQFDEFSDVSLCGDVLFRVRHLGINGARLTCLRFAFNTNYVGNNMLHFGQFEIDANAFNSCMVDVVFTDQDNSSSDSLGIDNEEIDRTKDVLKRGKEVSDKLRQGCDVSETGSDIEEIFLRKKLAAIKHEEPSIVTPVVSLPVAEPIGKQTAESVGDSGDDVDDFFAQLEKDAQI